MSNQPWGQPPQGPDPYQQQPPYDPQAPYGQQFSPYTQPSSYGQQPAYGQPVPYQGDPYAQNPYGQAPYAAGPYAARPRPGVGFGQAVRLYFKNYAVFSGRASRSEYWWVQVFLALVWTVWVVLCLMAGGLAAVIADSDPYGSTSAGLGAGLVILLVAGLVMDLALIVPNLAITWRRFHDTDRSGGFYFLSLIPYVGSIIEIILLAQSSVPTAWQRWDTGTLPAMD